MSRVRVIKFDVGAPTDRVIERVKANLGTTSVTEALTRGLAIAEMVTSAQASGRKVLIEKEDGTYLQLIP